MRYLIISFLRKMGGQIDEMVSVSKKLKQTELDSANVILDFADSKVVKSVIEGRTHDSTFGQLRDYYHRIYPSLVEQLEREATITADQEEPLNRKQRRAKK